MDIIKYWVLLVVIFSVGTFISVDLDRRARKSRSELEQWRRLRRSGERLAKMQRLRQQIIDQENAK